MTELVDLSGTWRAHIGEDDLHRRFVEHEFDDRDWATVEVPGHWRSQPGFDATDGPVLYRRSLAVPSPARDDRRRFLELDGIFYYGDVWLDADYLGATEGYFFPHAFELRALESDAEHHLAVEVTCPRQTDRTRKHIITGVFSHWDNLDPEWNPGGIWRPVRVVETGPVRITRLRAACSDANEERARLVLEATLDAGEHASAPLPARLVTRLTGPDGELLAEANEEISLAAGDNVRSWTLDVDTPPLWWPRRLGAQPLVDLEVSVEIGGETSDLATRRTALREVRMREWRATINGEPIFLMGSNQGPTRMQLAEAAPEDFERDVQLALEANLDLLRMHAHVSRPEMYAAADKAGLLLWQDFPLQWGYARIRKQATRQARAMVDLLAHHPSIVLWCGHNEPLAIDAQPGTEITPGQLARAGASMFLPSWNKDVLDRAVARAIRRADPTRPVDRHSGVLPGPTGRGTDSHFYFGWYHGSLDGLAGTLALIPRLARFVSEFGAQAVPESAEFMEPQRWPELDWDHLLDRHACQRRFFDEHVPPIGYATFDAWRTATQEYQAALVQLQIEDLRRLRFDPTGGFCHFCFADGHPSVTWSVLDHERRPKLGYDALRSSCRAVLPMVDLRTGRVHVVSERTETLRDTTLEVEVDGRTRRFRGDLGPGVTYVGQVDTTTATSVAVALEHPNLGTVTNAYPELLLRLVRSRPVR